MGISVNQDIVLMVYGSQIYVYLHVNKVTVSFLSVFNTLHAFSLSLCCGSLCFPGCSWKLSSVLQFLHSWWVSWFRLFKHSTPLSTWHDLCPLPQRHHGGPQVRSFTLSYQTNVPYNLQIEISAETCICCSWLLSGAITIDWINSIISNCLSVCKCCEQLLNWEHSYWQHTCTCVSHFNCCERIPQRDTVMEKTWDMRKDYISMLLHSLAKL